MAIRYCIQEPWWCGMNDRFRHITLVNGSVVRWPSQWSEWLHKELHSKSLAHQYWCGEFHNMLLWRMCHFQTSEYGIGVNLQIVWNLLCLCGMGDNPTIFLSERRCFIPQHRENAQQRKTQWRQQSDLPWSFYVPAEGSALVNLKHRYNEGPVYRLMIHSPNQNIQLLEPMKMISIARLYLVSFSTDCWLLLAVPSS